SLLIRRNIADGALAFFSTWCPKGTPIGKLVSVEGHRWAIEDSFETANNQVGLGHNETRSWHGWHRHVSLVILVFAMMTVIRHQACLRWVGIIMGLLLLAERAALVQVALVQFLRQRPGPTINSGKSGWSGTLEARPVVAPSLWATCSS